MENATKNMKQKWIRLVAAMLCMVTLFSLAACSGGNGDANTNVNGYNGPFDYEKSDLSPYITVSNSAYKGQTVQLNRHLDLAAYAHYKPEDLDDCIETLRYQYREYVASPVKSQPIAKGDDVTLSYVDIVLANGFSEDVDKKKEQETALRYFLSGVSENYTTLTVGLEILGKELDEALVGLYPKDSYVIKNADVLSLKEDDTVCLTYTLTYKNQTTNVAELETVKLSELDNKDLAKAIRERFTACGTSYQFALVTEKVDGEDVTVSTDDIENAEKYYTVTVHFVQEQQDITFDAAMPDDYFSENNGKDLMCLNGEKLTFTVQIASFVDYELPEVNAEFFKKTAEFETTEADPAKALAAYKEQLLVKLNKEQDELLQADKEAILWELAMEACKDKFSSLPGNKREEESADALEELLDIYHENYATVYSNADEFIYYQTQGYYSSVGSYASYMADLAIQQNLLMYWIFRGEGLSYTEEDVKNAYDEYIADAIETAKKNADEDDDTEYNEQYFIDKYTTKDRDGKEFLMRRVKNNIVVFEKVTEFMMKNNTFVETKSN